MGACGDGEPARPPAPVALPAPDRDVPVEGRLTVMTTERWDSARLMAEFERASGCRVEVVTAADDADAARRALDAGGRVDVVSSTHTSADRLVRGGAVQPIDEDALEHLSDVPGPLRRPSDVMRDDVRHGVPFAWDVDLLAYDTRRTPEPPTSWEALYDPSRRDRVAVRDGALQLGHAALVLPVDDPWALTAAELAAAATLVRLQAPLVRSRWRDPDAAGRLLRDGAVDLAQLPASTVAALQRGGAPVEGVVPREGTTGQIESWLLGARAPHRVCAYRFLDWIGSPAAQVLVSEVGGRAPVSTGACDLLGQPRCRALHVGDDAFLRSVRFVRTPEEPTDLREWQAAWAAVPRPSG